MEDMIIKGTGNFRWLKSVANIMTLYPTYESFAEALAAGTFPIDLNGINPAGVETPGTRLNKASLLTDALCTALGLATTATPTQAMDKLRTQINTLIAKSINQTYGTYTGTGTSSKRIVFNFTPRLIIISPQNEGIQVNGYSGLLYCSSIFYSTVGYVYSLSISGNSNQGYKINYSLYDDGFEFNQQKTFGDNAIVYPLTQSGKTYSYYAIG